MPFRSTSNITARAAVRAVLANLHLLEPARRLRNRWVHSRGPAAIPRAAFTPAGDTAPDPIDSAAAAYRHKIEQEISAFAQNVDVHDLPAIFHYWSNKYLLPKCLAFGFSHPDEFFANRLEACMRPGRTARFISLGAGNGDSEVRIAAMLLSRGHTDFVIECQDINEAMLARCKDLAAAHRMSRQVIPVAGDFNRWQPDGQYDAVMANQSLHHVLELEHLFRAVKQAIGNHGRFITSDMIGRNGHMRWPEARAIVDEFWAELPMRYRYHHQLCRLEERFMDWDCSTAGFEGIRAQDILPLLVKTFHFEECLAFGNIVDPFIDRGFGHNYDADSPDDRAFIDRLHARDEAEIEAGRIKPTHMMACMSNDASSPTKVLGNLTPAFCVRDPLASPMH